MSDTSPYRGELGRWVTEYTDTPEFNIRLLNTFRRRCWEVDYLRRHREYIEEHNRRGVFMGHGDRSVQYLFKLIVDELPESFCFLEIGVYKGQICSLMQLLADVTGRMVSITGITPLYDPHTHMGTGYVDYNRLPYIKQLYRDLRLTMDNTRIIDGFSQDPAVRATAETRGPFDILFIDGDHSYESTVADTVDYRGMVKPGGFLVIDDASWYKNFPRIPDPMHGSPVLWTGFEEAARAVRDHLEQDENFKEILCSMHVRVFVRTSAAVRV